MIATDRDELVATLDLTSGEFTDAGGAVYDEKGRQSTERVGRPKWATLSGGLVLGGRDFR